MVSVLVSFKLLNPSSKRRMWAEWKPGDINTDKIPKAVATIPPHEAFVTRKLSFNDELRTTIKQIPLSWSIISKRSYCDSSESRYHFISCQAIFLDNSFTSQKNNINIKPSVNSETAKTLPSVPCNFLLWPWSVCSNPWWSQWTSLPKSWDESIHATMGNRIQGNLHRLKWKSPLFFPPPKDTDLDMVYMVYIYFHNQLCWTASK